MRLERIITLANAPVRLRFLALERSLRAVGCDLPLEVIPYDERRFELPKNSSWWTIDPLCQWLAKQGSPTIARKYQCLTIGHYQFVDADVVFLRHPAQVLAGSEGFVASCTHWSNPGDRDSESLAVLRERSTCWPRQVFNSGQFACDRALFTLDELQRQCLEPRHDRTCLRLPYEQPAIVLLANLAGVPITNLTLPPTNMESTWAGDYAGEGYENYWRDESRKPYLIHWAAATCPSRAPSTGSSSTTSPRPSARNGTSRSRRARARRKRSGARFAAACGAWSVACAPSGQSCAPEMQL